MASISWLFGKKTVSEGARLTTTDIQTSTEGAVIGRLFGRARVSGQVIWATRFEEETTTTSSGGGKGGSSGGSSTTEYSYYGNFAVGLVEGPIYGIGRIWADGDELDQTGVTLRVYKGNETQEVDPLIEAKESGNAPAYRGLAYIVFERMPLASYGNRLPQIAVEVYRPTDWLESYISGVALIAGNEYGFDTELVKKDTGAGDQVDENRHTLIEETDFKASIQVLTTVLRYTQSVMLVVPWFGDDLRCGECTIRPKVDSADKSTDLAWRVCGVTRSGAAVVSYIGDEASAGGSPNDASVVHAIQYLTALGQAVTLCPFIMMDIAAGNTLPNPYSDNAATHGQPVYPWRGRITGSPAAGYAGTVDKTATALTQAGAFMGSAAPGDFGGSGTEVTYSGPAEWRYRRFVLHYAKLAAVAGGVDSFLIGSEMIGMTQLRSSATAYPFVAGLMQLAEDCRTLLGSGVSIGYTADWTEWANHRPDDGSGDVLFNLDPLWTHADIDFIGIDNYMPLADWRDGTAHLDFDADNGPTTIYDVGYLVGNVAAGEGYDWTYASQSARDAQTRTAIVDSDPADEPWVFRQKDIRNWWMNFHHDRPGGVRSPTTTTWYPQSKPIRFIEYGCPAVDKGANQPNVFYDPKSSESFFPYYSSGARDDAMQRSHLGALIVYWSDAGNNLTSSIYGDKMVDLTRSHAWAWDARPWPSFPLDTSWGDHANWETGHWLSGRTGGAPATNTIAAVAGLANFTDLSVSPIPSVVDGVTIGGLASPRSVLESLQPVYQFDAVESGSVLRFVPRLGQPVRVALTPDDLVADDSAADSTAFQIKRAQETELPDTVKLTYGDPARDDQSASASARRAGGGSARVSEVSPPVVMAENVARASAEAELNAAWVGRETATFSLPPSRLKLEPGDVVSLTVEDNRTRTLRLTTVGQAAALSCEAKAVEPAAFAPVVLPRSQDRRVIAPVSLAALAVFADGPLLADDDRDHAGYVGGVMAPFRGLAVYRSPTTSGYLLDTVLTLRAAIGRTTADFHSGPTGRWDRVNSLYVDILRGTLSSAEELLVLSGANTLLLQNQDGEWEVLQFATATPNGSRSTILTDLLRGQKGSEHAMRDPVPAGARVMLVSDAVKQTGIATSDLNLPLNWRAGPANEDIGSSKYVNQVVTLAGKARRPLSPAHLGGVRDPGTGNWTVSWIRRSRIGGDDFDAEDIPLGETAEYYKLEILDGPGGSVLRTVEQAVDTFTYTAAMQTADFGSIQWSFTARVSQKSSTYGYGIATEALIWIR